MRRFIFAAFIVALLGSSAFTLSGCGALGRRRAPTPLPPVELKLTSFDAVGSWNEAEEALIEQYRERQPNVTFDRSTYSENPAALLGRSSTPDIMVISPGYLLDAAVNQQQLVDLSDVWEQSGLTEDYPPSFVELSAHNGKQYYLPVAFTWTAIYYNMDLFDEYWLTPPATWNEFITVCDTLIANDVTPLSIAGQDVFQSTLWFDYLNLRLNGLDFYRQLTNGTISFEDDRVSTVFELWGWMLDSRYFMEHPEQMSATDNTMAVVTTPEGLPQREKAAMTLAGPSWLGYVPANLRESLDFFPFPEIDDSIPSAEALTAYGYMIPAGAESIDAALSFVEYAGSSEAQSEMIPRLNVSEAGLAPANPSADRKNLSESVQRGAAIVENADGVTPFFVLAVPVTMWAPADRAFRYFLQNPWDIQTTVGMLEEARQTAHDLGMFLPEQ